MKKKLKKEIQRGHPFFHEGISLTLESSHNPW